MFYVYFAYSGEELVYIGEGKGKRYKKIVSGISHCYEANKAHFSGELLRSEIVETFDTKEEAVEREKVLIFEHKPKWNTTHTQGTKTKFRIRKRILKKTTKWEVNRLEWREGKWAEKTVGRFLTEDEARRVADDIS